jgi:hypothetical protein
MINLSAGLFLLSASVVFGSSISSDYVTEIVNLGTEANVCVDSHSSAGPGSSQVQCGFSVTNAENTLTSFSGTAKSAGNLGSVDSFTQVTVNNVQPLNTATGIDIYGGVDVSDSLTNNSNSPILLTATATLTGTTTSSNDPQFETFFRREQGRALSRFRVNLNVIRPHRVTTEPAR